jgi:hypothetical protein
MMTDIHPLAELEPDFSAEHQLYGTFLKSPGYHTQVPHGTWVHQTRENLEIAHELLSSGKLHWVERGTAIVEKILSLQDQNPLSPTYGIWSWLYEEPLEEMNPPDWNWSDFLGLKLAEILFDHSEKLSDTLIGEIKTSLSHASHSIFRRNVQAGYTNIAVKGGCVSVIAGELLKEPWLADYGQRRLEAVIEHFKHHGGFNEYNSPTYSQVVLKICETGLRIIQNQRALQSLEQIHRFEWESLSSHYHPTTKQLCGPQSRTYSDFLDPQFQHFLGVRTGALAKGYGDDYAVPCPTEFLERFTKLPAEQLETKHQHIHRDKANPSIGTVWLSKDTCLGSISQDTMWDQRRPILGYWLGATGQPVALKVRMIRNGRSFASGFVWNAQSGSKILSVFNFITDAGDFHPHFGKPNEGNFGPSDLRLCYELHGEEVRANILGDGLFELRSGSIRALVHTGARRFQGREVVWGIRHEENLAIVEASLNSENEVFNILGSRDNALAVALEVLSVEQTPHPLPPTTTLDTESATLQTYWEVNGSSQILVTPLNPTTEAIAHKFGQ